MSRGFSVRRERLLIAGAAAVALAVGLASLSPAPVGVFWDDGVYVITAKALATGHGYRFIHLPGAPAATHYPPLWPILLSIVWRIMPAFPDNVRWMKLLNPVLLGAGAAGATLLAIRVARIPRWLAASIVAATVIVAPMLLLSAVLMSEPLCLALAAPARASATLVVLRGRTRDALVAGVLAGLAILARSAAIVLLPGLAIGLLWHRSRRASAVALATALVLTVPWFAWSAAHAHELGPSLIGSYGPYATWVVDGYRDNLALLPAVIARNAATMFREAGIVVFSALPRAARSPLLAILLGFTVAGLWWAGRRVMPLVSVMVAYLVLTLVWPYAPGRFTWTFFSLYAIVAAAAVSALVRRARTRRGWRIPAAAAMGVSFLALASVVRYDAVGFRAGWQRLAVEANAGHIAESVGAIARLTAPTDTVATDVNLTAYLYADRISVPTSMLTVAEYLQPKSDAEVRAEFAAIDAAFHPRWWIATGLVRERFALAAWVADTAHHLRVVAHLPNGGLAARAERR